MAKVLMFVYGDITTDARVQRAADVVSNNNELILVSLKTSRTIETTKYLQQYVGGKSIGRFGLFYAIISTIIIIKKCDPEIVYCHDYFSSILAFFLLNSKFRGKIVYDAHELIIPEDGRNDRRLRFFYWFERRIVKRVDLIVCASRERGDLMKKHYKLYEIPMEIPNVSVLTLTEDLTTQNLMRSLQSFFQIPKKTVVYAGVISKGRKLELLLEAILKKKEDFKLLIVGGGAYLEELRLLSTSYKDIDVFFTGPVPYTSLGTILSKCSIGYLYYPTDTLNNRFCASNKIYEYSSVELPIISNNNPTIKSFFEKYPIGYASDDFQEALYEIGNRMDEFKINCRTLNAESHWKKYSKKLSEAIQNL